MITKYFNHTTYSITLEIITSGIIEQVDIIGSLYNQLREVLKDKVSFEELVKAGKIGTIEVNISKFDLKSNNKIKNETKALCIIPTNLKFSEVCLLAAKCEHITKIGYVKGVIKVIDISYDEQHMEKTILHRAKELEQQFAQKISTKQLQPLVHLTPQITELIENVYSTRNCKRFKTIYLVEGRTDVKNLVSYGIYNVISINGSNLDILRLKNEKWFQNKELITLFDGDSSAKKLFEQINKELSISKELYAPKGVEVSELSKEQIEKVLQVSLKSNTKKIEKKKEKIRKVESNEFNDNNSKKHYFLREEYIIIENYLEAIKEKRRIVGFDETFAIVFDEDISKLKELDFLEISYILYDGLCENIFKKKVLYSAITCIIAKGFSSKIEGVECITFEEFQKSIVE